MTDQAGGARSESTGASVCCLGGDGVVAFEGFANFFGRDGAFAADAPVIAAKFDDGGGQGIRALTGIDNEGNAVAELVKHFLAAFAGGRTGKIGAGAGERNAEFGDKIVDDFVPGPAEGNAAGVGGNFEGQAVGSVDDDRERAGPAGLRQAIKVVGKVLGEYLRVNERIDENRKSLVLGASLDAEDLFDGRKIDGIGGQGV